MSIVVCASKQAAGSKSNATDELPSHNPNAAQPKLQPTAFGAGQRCTLNKLVSGLETFGAKSAAVE